MFDFDSSSKHTACITSTGRSILYGELDQLTNQIGRLVKPHQLVFSLCSNTIGSIAGYVTFLRNDDAMLLLDANMAQESFDALERTYHPRYIWAPASCRLFCNANPIFEAENYVLWECRQKGSPIADQLAVLLATSGSTGSPKVVRLSKENLRANAHSIIEYLHITEAERPVLGLPMHYAFGLSVVNSHLMQGATLLLTQDSFVQREFWEFAIGQKFTSYSGVPYAFEVIKKLGIWKQEMPTLRTLAQAGGALSCETLRFFDETFTPRGIRFYVMYGQAEATARMAYLDPAYLKTKAGSIGKAIPGGKLSLVDNNGKTITAPDTVGELVYAGVNASLGYAEKAQDLLEGDENHGVIHTGDMAFRDAEGFYYITGRKNRFIKLFGHRINLDHVEELVHPLLTEYACTGDDAQLTIFTADDDFDEASVVDLLAARTAIPRKAFQVRQIDRIPRSASGKIQYELLRNV